MSSFVVDDKTINRVLTFIYFNQYGSKAYIYSHLWRKFEDMGYTLKDTDSTVYDELGSNLYSLNYAAVNDRYGEGHGFTVQTHYFKHKTEQAKTLQVLKSLQCLLYQCSEGNVPERPLYKLLQELEHAIMSDIIHGMPEYEAAAWG